MYSRPKLFLLSCSSYSGYSREIVNFEIQELNEEEKEKDRKYKCETCGKLFLKRSNMWRHELIHTGTKKFQCNICPKSYTRKESLNNHMLVHFSVDPVTCTICQKNLKNRYTLKRHVKIHSAERIHVCGICGFKFYHKANVKRHIIDVHKQNPEYPGACPRRSPSPPCRYCGKIFWKDGEFASHMLEEHNDDKPFQCSICLKKFKVKLYLTRHMAYHEIDKVFSCEICGKSFRRREYLRIHRLRVHEYENINKNIAEHENVQEVDDKPFECSICLKKFKQKIYLKKHMVRHETNKPNTPYSCAICKISFKTKEYFWRHQAKHHKIKIKKISKPKEKSGQEIETKFKEENLDDGCTEIPNKPQFNPENCSVIKIEKE